jgi:hypothetical protein
MKNKSTRRATRDLFMERIQGTDLHKNILELVRRDSELKRSNNGLKNLLRWEDDGGQMLRVDPVDRPNTDRKRPCG